MRGLLAYELRLALAIPFAIVNAASEAAINALIGKPNWEYHGPRTALDDDDTIDVHPEKGI